MENSDFENLKEKFGFAAAVVIVYKKTKSKKLLKKLSNENQPLEEWLKIYFVSGRKTKLSEATIEIILNQANNLDDLIEIYFKLPHKYREIIVNKALELDKNKNLENGFEHWEKILLILSNSDKQIVEICVSHMYHYAKNFYEWAKLFLISGYLLPKSDYFQLITENINNLKVSVFDWLLFYYMIKIDCANYYNLDIVLTIINEHELSLPEWEEIYSEVTDEEISSLILFKMKKLY